MTQALEDLLEALEDVDDATRHDLDAIPRSAYTAVSCERVASETAVEGRRRMMCDMSTNSKNLSCVLATCAASDNKATGECQAQVIRCTLVIGLIHSRPSTVRQTLRTSTTIAPLASRG